VPGSSNVLFSACADVTSLAGIVENVLSVTESPFSAIILFILEMVVRTPTKQKLYYFKMLK
jgi:hypothetical protein